MSHTSSELPLVSAAVLELGSKGILPSNCIDAALTQPRGNCLRLAGATLPDLNETNETTERRTALGGGSRHHPKAESAAPGGSRHHSQTPIGGALGVPPPPHSRHYRPCWLPPPPPT